VQSTTVSGQQVSELIKHDLKRRDDEAKCICFAEAMGYSGPDLEPFFEGALNRVKTRIFAANLLR